MNARARKTLHSHERNDWRTPPEIVALVRRVGRGTIGLDPCAHAQGVVGAVVEWRKEALVDGLAGSWKGHGLVYCNPPYGREIDRWIAKCRKEAEAGAEIIALVPSRTDTNWFATAGAKAQCSWKGRITFMGATNGAPFPSAVLYWGSESGVKRFLTVFRKHGRCERCQPPAPTPASRSKGPRIALYHRVSTADQDVTLAREELQRYCDGRGARAVVDVEEVGTGARNDRPGLRQVLEAASRRTIDLVVVWKLDRWGRSAHDILANIKELTRHGVGFVATTQGIVIEPDGSSTSQLVLTVLAAVAEFERDLIRERSRLGIERARAAGRRGPGRLPQVDGARAHKLHEDGKTWREVGKLLGCAPSNAHAAARRHREANRPVETAS